MNDDLINIAHILNDGCPVGITLWCESLKRYLKFHETQTRVDGHDVDTVIAMVDDEETRYVFFDKFGRRYRHYYGSLVSEDVDLFPTSINKNWESDGLCQLFGDPKCVDSIICDEIWDEEDGEHVGDTFWFNGGDELWDFNENYGWDYYRAWNFDFTRSRFATREESEKIINNMKASGMDFIKGKPYRIEPDGRRECLAREVHDDTNDAFWRALDDFTERWRATLDEDDFTSVINKFIEKYSTES